MDFVEGIRSSKQALSVAVALLLSALLVISCFFLDTRFHTSRTFLVPKSVHAKNGSEELAKVLERAATPNRTVILTSVNNAWLAPGSLFDLFRESIRTGNNTETMLKHLVVVSFDHNAYSRCLELNLHCYFLQVQDFNFSGEAANFMTPAYLEIVWRKIDFLHSVLSLGYNFLFSDTDIVWFRDPFPHLQDNVDFQVSCDLCNGNSIFPNTGIMYVKSNRRTILFHELWYNARHQYKGRHDQDVFNTIRGTLFEIIGITVKFLDTNFFGGFCTPSKDLNQVCTMHANCCVGLDHKVHDLKLVLEDWRKYSSASPPQNPPPIPFKWSAPKQC